MIKQCSYSNMQGVGMRLKGEEIWIACHVTCTLESMTHLDDEERRLLVDLPDLAIVVTEDVDLNDCRYV